MRSNKNSLIVTVIAIIVILALAGFLVYNQVQKNKDDNLGTETIQVVSGVGQGFKGEIKAQVSYEFGKIIDLYLVGENETPEIGGAAMDRLKLEILQNGTTSGVDAVSGATYTSQGVFDAIADASTKLILK